MAISAFSQNKTFSFNEIQSRNNLREWDKCTAVSERTVLFSAEGIDLKLEKDYHLSIINTTHLPEKGVVYLCRDEKLREVTVMLINDKKMFLYDDKKRFLINFNEPALRTDFNKSYADTD